MTDEVDEALARELRKLADSLKFSRQVLRMGLGFYPISLRERVLERYTAFQEQVQQRRTLRQEASEQNQAVNSSVGFLLGRRPLLERLSYLQKTLDERRQKQKEVEEQKKREAEEKAKAEAEARKKAEEEEAKKRREESFSVSW